MNNPSIIAGRCGHFFGESIMTIVAVHILAISTSWDDIE